MKKDCNQPLARRFLKPVKHLFRPEWRLKENPYGFIRVLEDRPGLPI